MDKLKIIKLFDEVLKKYENAEKKNLESIIKYTATGYDRQIERLNHELREYRKSLNEMLNS